MQQTTFYRPARSYPEPLPEESIKIDVPPTQPEKEQGASALLQFLYPLSGVLITVVSIFAYTSFNQGQPNYLIIAAEVSIIPLSIGIMFLSNFLQRRGRKQRLKAEHDAYRRYLAARRRRILDISKLQHQRNARLYPDDVTNVIVQRQSLWERRPLDPDFLAVRVGLAPVPLCCPVEFQEDERVTYIADLLQEAREIVVQNGHIQRQPVIVSLSGLGTFAVTGNPTATRPLVRALICQIIAFHSPNEVRLIATFPAPSVAEWDWLKWLPHTRHLRAIKRENSEAPELRNMLAKTPADFQEIMLTQIKPELERRNKMNQEGQGNGVVGMQKLPHLVFVLDGFMPEGALTRIAGVEEMLRDSTRLGITILCLVERPEYEPATIRGRLTLSSLASDVQLEYKEMSEGGKSIAFIAPDRADVNSCERLARQLAPLQLIDMDAEFDFSPDVHLLALQQVPSVEALQVANAWRTRTEHDVLCIPIGQQKRGPLMLDLKEMAVGGYGPHGMVVGATGSGKSELLRTIVMSLAMTHDPHTVNFVLVDFKAGAAFADFAALPHVAGIITNLENDSHLIGRMYTSLLGEQQRRQQLLSSAGNLSNIRQYQARWRRTPGMEPMPYLIIIVDEFAQLIANHEEFLTLFTKFGQVGRSLGMHMMLSTQRVDEGRIQALEGHLRYRICLRTFKADESSAVLGRPDAYYLPPLPGSGYFKVDNDIFTSFKAALISTPYIPEAQQQVDPLTLIRVFSHGKLIPYLHQTQPSSRDDDMGHDESRTEMAMVIEHIHAVPAPIDSWRVHPVWQPPLPTTLSLAEVFKRYDQGNLDGSRWQRPFGMLRIPIGLVDRPAAQKQEPLLLDFSGVEGHLVIVGAPQSGKSTLLRTIITALLITHSPADVQLYCIDLGGGLLRAFEGAPHVGAICGKTDRDKTRRVLRRMQQILVEREALFAEHGIDSMNTYRQRRQQGQFDHEALGDVFLIIDNLSQLQNDFEVSDPELTSDILTLVANGLTYGVHVLITANQWIEVRPKLRSNIGARLELRLNDANESEIDRKQAPLLSQDVPGRGLHPQKLVFQTALPVIASNADPRSVQEQLELLIRRLRGAWVGAPAPQILVLPSEVSWDMLSARKDEQVAGVPLGLEEFHLRPFSIDIINSDPHVLLLGDRECGKTTLIHTWIHGIEQCYSSEQVKFALIDYRKTSLDSIKSEHLLAYAMTPDKVKECVNDLKTLLEQRIEMLLQQPMEQLRNPQPWQGQHFVLFVDDYELVATASPQSGNPLNALEGVLQSAREIGFHLVLARRIIDFGKTNYDPIFKSVKNMESPGLIMRGDPIEGRQVLHRYSASDTLPVGRGAYVRRGAPPMLIQVARNTRSASSPIVARHV